MSLIEQAGRFASGTFWSALHLLYPPVCPLCNASLEGESASAHRFICTLCIDSVEKIEGPVCWFCGDPLDSTDIDLCERCAFEPVPYEQARSVGIYDGSLARAIQLLKYERERALARTLAPLLAESLSKLDWELDAITFVPLHSRSQRLRGFNQSELLARALGKLTEHPVIPTLRKTLATRPQMELTGSERRENLSGAFKALRQEFRGKLLLIDDVFTTGTTVSECSGALRNAGVEGVYVLTLARAPLTDQLGDTDED